MSVADSMELSVLISRVDKWLAENRPEYYAHLKPGLDDAILDDFEQRFSLKLPADLRAFYSWRDGQAGTYDSLQDGRMFSPLVDIEEAKSMLDDMIGTDFEDPKCWRKSWVPFLANRGGDHLCLELAAEDGGEPGQLIAFWHDWDDRSAEARAFVLGSKPWPLRWRTDP